MVVTSGGNEVVTVKWEWTVLLLEVEQSVVTGGFKADIYYRIKAIHKV